MSARHEPVLLAEVLGFLRAGPGLYLDATLGDGGHAFALLEAEPEARLLGTDRDALGLAFARERLARFGSRVTLAQATFGEVREAHLAIGAEPFTGALMDLGLSSRQIDDPSRGMSFGADGPLDLRFDTGSGTPLRARLTTAGEAEIADALHVHGDVPRSRALARAIVGAAREGRLERTSELCALIDRVLGGRPHPRRYAQVFQALRTWINDEARDLDGMLEWLPGVMRPGGVVVTLAYHSGEDRRIKQAVRGRVTFTPRRLPVAIESAAVSPWEALTSRVVRPSEQETATNPRARSARLRAFRRKRT
ncbi:MAG: 16S rRNA (cytosine(1402)-N(4))-methyltransferase RsmH [Candidatus Eisenbacteria bacterium]|uniref:Ribosomal RNA small subunit methyltransferase H n=1 Tax=Eiseniibacteriota bacterium TaxID=2212470 RepID=A0A849SKS8_UNCEI|nr:16S rRNA (cytosine(1402)-N(4))-methyltransferase RsmH [Candidatus Eisenbacteria bacterium]